MASEFVGRIGYLMDPGVPERPADLRFTLSKTHGCKDKVACSTTTWLTMNLRCHPSITKQISPQTTKDLRGKLLVDNLKPEPGE